MDALKLVQQDVLECMWEAPQYLIFSSEVDPLVYYSHLFPAFAILILAGLLLLKNKTPIVSKYFVSIALLFSIYAFFDLIVWASINPSVIMFFWSLLIYIEPLLYIATLFLVLTYIKQKEVSKYHLCVAGIIMLPILIFGPTNLNLAGFNYTDCWRLAVEGPLATIYVYIVEFIILAWLLIEGIIYTIKHATPSKKKQSFLMLSGSLLFLAALSSGNIFGTLLQNVMGEDSWVIGQYGFFGMPLFLAFILYLIVKFEAFRIKLIGANAITFTLWILLAALLFVNDITTARGVIAVTLILFTFFGYLLIKSVQQEVEQRQKIQDLAVRLEKANSRLKELDKLKSEFVSIASHQLRSPLTAIRGYASMLLEGSYGNLTTKATEAIRRIAESSQFMASSIEDYLSVSRIQAGNMKYEKSDFNLKELASHIVDDLRAQAVRKGLMLTFKSDSLTLQGVVNADKGKTQQIIHNLINNAIKYTPKGSITVVVRDLKRPKKICLDVIDTGIGMDSETIEHMFDKFERAKNANSVNVDGTGLGLFIARKMATDMGGEITATSSGEGKGSIFTLCLPLQM